MRVLLTVATLLVSLAAVALVAFFAVLILAGPHSSMLPNWMGGPMLALAWLAVIVLPVLAARRVWIALAPK
ncbi:MAG: hypothetical protein SFV54_12660 [Bryobacteraceae bacterium]|nr:hypothetical protein [Bryobacteraceae bacterium]